VASSPASEAKGKPFRESSLSDRALCTFDVVPHAAKLESIGVHVPHAIACRREAVPRLADATGVDERRTVEPKCINAVFVRHGAIRKPGDSANMRARVPA